jgi:hypothetical protein
MEDTPKEALNFRLFWSAAIFGTSTPNPNLALHHPVSAGKLISIQRPSWCSSWT